MGDLMTYKPTIISMDFEATGLDYWAPDFRVLSCAFAWRGVDGELRTKYTEGENDTRNFLRRICVDGVGLVAHNVPYEWGVCSYRFSDLDVAELIRADTMRLLQVADNGGHDDYGVELSLEDELAALEGFKRRRTGLSLESGVRRHLSPDLHNHKEPFYKWLRDSGVRRGEEGANLDRLPRDQFIEYNVLDAVRTLQLYETLTSEFEAEGYDWQLDHSMYLFMAKQISRARGTGIRVDTGRARDYAQRLQDEVNQIDAAFRERFLPHIRGLETAKQQHWCEAPKTDRGRARRVEQVESGLKTFTFNVNSTTQLKELFCDELGIKPKYCTAKGNPSFAAAFCTQWGEGGQMLGDRKSKLLSLKQTESLIALSTADGRWHVDLRAAGTKTGRMAANSQKG